MTIDERKRRALYQRCEDVFGDEHADTLMERAELHQALRQQLWAIFGVLVMAIVISEAISRLG
jgi:hypothetical protein